MYFQIKSYNWHAIHWVRSTFRSLWVESSSVKTVQSLFQGQLRDSSTATRHMIATLRAQASQQMWTKHINRYLVFLDSSVSGSCSCSDVWDLGKSSCGFSFFENQLLILSRSFCLPDFSPSELMMTRLWKSNVGRCRSQSQVPSIRIIESLRSVPELSAQMPEKLKRSLWCFRL